MRWRVERLTATGRLGCCALNLCRPSMTSLRALESALGFTGNDSCLLEPSSGEFCGVGSSHSLLSLPEVDVEDAADVVRVDWDRMRLL